MKATKEVTKGIKKFVMQTTIYITKEAIETPSKRKIMWLAKASLRPPGEN